MQKKLDKCCPKNTYDYAFLCLYTQSRHFDNSKMVNGVNLVQKLTKIQHIQQMI